MAKKNLYKLLIVVICMMYTISCSQESVEYKAEEEHKETAESPKSPGYLGMSLPADFQVFSPDSPWNTPIGENPELDEFSDMMINNLANKVKGIQWSWSTWTIPMFVIDSDKTPKVDIPTTSKYHLYKTVDPDGNDIAEGIPMPVEAWPDPEDDSHMLLVDPVKRRTWDFSFASQISANQWQASIIDTWDLDSKGYRAPFETAKWRASGARAGGTPLIAGLIRPEQIKAGKINNALSFASPVNRLTTYHGGTEQLCSPVASRTDGRGVGYEYIPEGARLQLDPSLDLNSLGLSDEVKIIAKAMQEYGMFNVDGSSAFKIYLQNLGPDGGEWKNYDFTSLSKIPVNKFRVIKCNLVSREEQ